MYELVDQDVQSWYLRNTSETDVLCMLTMVQSKFIVGTSLKMAIYIINIIHEVNENKFFFVSNQPKQKKNESLGSKNNSQENEICRNTKMWNIKPHRIY